MKLAVITVGPVHDKCEDDDDDNDDYDDNDDNSICQQVSWYTIHSCIDKAWLCWVLTLRPWSTHVISPHFSFQSTIVPFESCLSASSLCPFLVYPPRICYLLHVFFSLLSCLDSLIHAKLCWLHHWFYQGYIKIWYARAFTENHY